MQAIQGLFMSNTTFNENIINDLMKERLDGILDRIEELQDEVRMWREMWLDDNIMDGGYTLSLEKKEKVAGYWVEFLQIDSKEMVRKKPRNVLEEIKKI